MCVSVCGKWMGQASGLGNEAHAERARCWKTAVFLPFLFEATWCPANCRAVKMVRSNATLRVLL